MKMQKCARSASFALPLFAFALAPMLARAELVPVGGVSFPVQSPISGNIPVVADAQSAPFEGATAMTVGTSYTAARSVLANCTVAGNVSLTLLDGSTVVWAVPTGATLLRVAATAVNTSGTTATCTYYNLK